MTAMTQLYQKPLSPPAAFQPNITHGPIASSVVPVYKPPAVLPIPVNATPIAVLPPPSVPAAPLPYVITLQKTQPDDFKPPQPVMAEIPNAAEVFNPRQPVMAEIPNGAPSQVVVLSKSTGHYANDRKANSGNTLLDHKTYAIAALLAILSRCFI